MPRGSVLLKWYHLLPLSSLRFAQVLISENNNQGTVPGRPWEYRKEGLPTGNEL